MELANCMVAIGGDKGNTVPKYRVTPGEILVLMAVHGNDAVFDVEPLDAEIDRSNREEVARLRQTYGTAKNHDDEPVVSVIFPGAAARAPETIEDLDLDETLFKPAARLTKAEAPKRTKRTPRKAAEEASDEAENSVEQEGSEDPFE